MFKKETIFYTLTREGYTKRFTNRITAKIAYRKMKEQYPDTVLTKTIIRATEMTFDDKSECWL